MPARRTCASAGCRRTWSTRSASPRRCSTTCSRVPGASSGSSRNARPRTAHRDRRGRGRAGAAAQPPRRRQDRFAQLGGYEVEAEAHRVLAGLGFPATTRRRPTGELSGGWRVRVALARLLLSKPDLLVLDEPTNHLDLDTIAWLEQTLNELPGGLLFVSHDRDFIDGVADRIVELAAGTARSSTRCAAGPRPPSRAGSPRSSSSARSDSPSSGPRRRQQDRQLAQAERFIERFRYKASKARQVQSRIKAVERSTGSRSPTTATSSPASRSREPQRSGRVGRRDHRRDQGLRRPPDPDRRRPRDRTRPQGRR